MAKIKWCDWSALKQKLNELAPIIGMGWEERKEMIDPLSCLFFHQMVIDITKFGKWMERRYPEYLNKSIEQFLLDKDPDHIQDWKDLMGIGEPYNGEG